jgi:hypothetical protein
VAALGLLDAIHGAADDGVVSAIVGARLGDSPDAMATSIRKAAGVTAAIASARYELFEAAAGLTGDRAPAGAAIQQRVREAFEKDELAVALDAALRAAESDAARLLAAVPAPPPSPAPPAPPGMRVVERSSASGLDASRGKEVLDRLRRRLAEKPSRRLSIEWSIEEPEDTR